MSNNDTPMDKMDESLSNIFEVEPMIVTDEDRKHAITIIPDLDNQDKSDDELMEFDHQEVRKNIHHLIQQGHVALDYALELAKESDSARGFEVVAGMMKTISDMNTQLMDTHRSKKATKHIGAKRMEGGEATGSTTNNAIFVGSTTELAKMIESMTNKKG